MTSLSSLSQVDATRHAENLASSLNLLDEHLIVIRAQAEALVYSWSTLQRALADYVLDLIVTDPTYRPAPEVILGLGGNFAEGPLHEAAIRAGYLRPVPDAAQPYDEVVSDDVNGSGVLAAIEAAVA